MIALSIVIESEDFYVHQLLIVADDAAAFKAVRDLAEAKLKPSIFNEDEWADVVEEYPTDKELVEFLSDSLDGDVLIDYKMEPLPN